MIFRDKQTASVALAPLIALENIVEKPSTSIPWYNDLIIKYDQFPLLVSIAESRPPSKIVDLPLQSSRKVSRVWAKGDASTAKHRRLLITQTRTSSALLGSDLATAAVNVFSPLGAGCALPRCVSFEDYGAMEDVPPHWQIQVFGVVPVEANGLERGPGVDGREHFRGVDPAGA